MTVAWCGVACHEPPAVAVATARSAIHWDGITAHGPSRSMSRARTWPNWSITAASTPAQARQSGLFWISPGMLDGVPLSTTVP
jgi:flavin reductase (DIM6/NTAB) family NADH-FMN oxidoreductase RutF